MTEEKAIETIFNGYDITPGKDRCLLKDILREGTGDETPMYDDKVQIHCIGSLMDGTVFENSRDRGKVVSFNLGRGDVLKAWEMGVATMKQGEIAKFLSKPKHAYGLKGLEGKVPPATSVFFEIELVHFEGKDISREGNRTVLRRVLRRGEAAETPNEDSSAEIRLKGIYQGEVFDDRTVSFIVGAGCVDDIPPGVEVASYRMTKNEFSKLYLSGDATKGLEKFNIPTGAPVVYEVTMLKFDRAKDIDRITDDEKLREAVRFKERADRMVKHGYYALAIPRYRHAFNTLLSAALRSDLDQKESRQMKFASQLNLALCYLKVGNNPECRRSCEMALAFDARCEKALFRRGQCQLAARNFDQAIEDFETVLEINPSNEAAKQQIEQCHREIKAYKIQEKELYHSFLLRKKGNARTKIEDATIEEST